jgi:2,3-bisphosphoglycerate-dependent phosphoglycerate mutase
VARTPGGESDTDVSDLERRLYLIRHGKADHRSTGETITSRGAVADPPLDEVGREQARVLARRLAKMPAPAAIYCSTLARARQTIEPFADATGAKVTYLEDLVEWYGGEWEFKEFEELLVEHPEIPRRVLLQDPLFYLAPGGESFQAFAERVAGAIEEGITANPEGDVWVVCHGGVINAYIGRIIGMREQEMFFLPPNTSINTVKVRGDARRLWFLADDTHWTEPGLFFDAETDAPT